MFGSYTGRTDQPLGARACRRRGASRAPGGCRGGHATARDPRLFRRVETHVCAAPPAEQPHATVKSCAAKENPEQSGAKNRKRHRPWGETGLCGQ